MRSHSYEELVAAFLVGDQIWAVDTDSDGEDDILIGSEREVRVDLCHHFEIEELPSHWSLSRWEPEKEQCSACEQAYPKVANPLDLSVYREQVVFADTDGQVRCWSCSDQFNE